MVRSEVVFCPPCGTNGKIWGNERDIGGSLVGVYVVWFPCGCVNVVEYVYSMELVGYDVTTAIGRMRGEPCGIVSIEETGRLLDRFPPLSRRGCLRMIGKGVQC